MRVTWLHVFVHGLIVISAINVLLEEVSGTSNPKWKPPQITKKNKTCRCPMNWNPVCGRNNKSYQNPCFMGCDGLKEGRAGLCEDIDKPKVDCPCPRHISLVCGMNNKTYFNECLMKCDGQKEKHKGSCEAGPGEPGGWPWEEESIQDKLKMREDDLDCVCGMPNQNEPQMLNRIAGGEEATPYQYGWMVYMETDVGTCGATIINDRMLLTAAHCMVYAQNPEDMSIKPEERIGNPENVKVKLNIHNKNGDEQAISIPVESVLVHPGFIPVLLKGGWDYDIAIVVLKGPLVFAPSSQNGIRPICLPKLGEEVKTVGEAALATGWGLTNPEDSSSAAEKLQQLGMSITSLEVCRNVSKLEHPLDHYLCAGTLDVYKNALPGDSGGPLQMKHGEQWTQVGVTSWGEGYYFPDEDETPDKILKYAVLYMDLTIPVSLQYIYYQAHEVGVGWCKSTTSNGTNSGKKQQQNQLNRNAKGGKPPTHQVQRDHTTRKSARRD